MSGSYLNPSHKSYATVKRAAAKNPKRYAHLLAPEDRPPVIEAPAVEVPAKEKPGNRGRRAKIPDETVAPGIVVRIREAGCKGGCFQWTVLVDDRPTEKGDEKTREAARDAALAEARAIAATR